MSGNKRYLFDTNAVIALLGGDAGLWKLWQSGQWAGISIVSVLEFLAWPDLDAEREAIFRRFLQRLKVVDLIWSDDTLMAQVITLRKSKSLKLPDAIVLASAMSSLAVLVTRDEKLLTAAELVLPGLGLRY
ncbi:MAG: type II toxin-antitoxin system VapC family toxin [Rhodocyclaceae bacterium]|nr:type II toxin-antitoxin system VapC family toxin [Rhodocyclaceae bacterium]